MRKTHRVTLVFPDGREVPLSVAEDVFLLDAAAQAGIDLPHTCLQGWCVTCAGRVLDDPATCVDHRAARRYFPEDEEGGFVLLCTARPLRACRIATHQAEALRAYRRRRGLPAPRG
jgi:ferredoxin